MHPNALDNLAAVADKETTDILRNAGIFAIEVNINFSGMLDKLDDIVELLDSALPEADDVEGK